MEQTTEQWRGPTRAIGQPALADDPRLASATGRLRRHDELDATISAWTCELPKLGAHNAELQRELGCTADERARIIERGMV